MNSPIQRLVLRPLAAASLLFPCLAPAQSQVAATPGPQTVFHILEQNRIRVGGHTITYNRVAPPVFASSAVTPTPAPASAAPSPAFNESPPGTQSAFEFLCFSATVYDGQFTLLRWRDSSGEFFAVSSINFDLLSSVPEFNTPDTDYTFFMALDNEPTSSADVTTAAWLAQAAQTFSTENAEYLIVSGSASPDGLQALQDFHAFFDANRAALITAYHQRQTANALRLRQMREHPPAQPDTVINYWRKTGNIVLTGTGRVGQ